MQSDIYWCRVPPGNDVFFLVFFIDVFYFVTVFVTSPFSVAVMVTVFLGMFLALPVAMISIGELLVRFYSLHVTLVLVTQ